MKTVCSGWLLVALLSLAACRTGGPVAPPGDALRHHNWWNYYERGEARLKAGDFQGAREDFERALGTRPGARFGYDAEAWRVRTYGMHFLDGYFPRRELGVASYHLGDLAAARRALEQSLATTPSGRAKHFLNEVNRRSREGRPQRAPEIELRDGERLAVTRERRITIAGTARAEGLVREIQVGEWNDFIELAEPQRVFEHLVALRPGTNEIVVRVRDLLGAETRRTVRCVADWTPPALAITNVTTEGGQWTLRGVCYDDAGLDQLMVQGRSSPPGRTAHALAVTGTARLGEPVKVTATDTAGNVLDVAVTREAAQGATAQILEQRWAQADAEEISDAAASAPYQPRDRLKPYLKLSEQREHVTVYRNEFFLDGRAEDGGGLQDVYLNGEPLLPDELKGKARSFYLARRLLLNEGTNELEVAAVDRAGNATVNALRVIYRRPEMQRDELRLRVGLLPLEAGSDPASADAIRWVLWEELGRPPARFTLLQRDQMQTILGELELSASALADPGARLRVGRLLPAELFLFGAVHTHEQGSTVFVQLFQSEDSEIIYTDDVYVRSPAQDLEPQLSGLARKVEQRFPRLDGKILRRSGSKAVIDAGRRQGLDRGSRFLVVPPAGEADEEGRVLRAGERPVELHVSSVAETEGTAAIVPPDAGNTIKEGWTIHAR